MTALRANIVLFSISATLAIVLCFGLMLIFGELDDGMPEWPWQAYMFAAALIIMLLLRWCAWLAFNAAARANKVQRSDEPDHIASLADDCSHAWLVQLHLELRGHRCAD